MKAKYRIPKSTRAAIRAAVLIIRAQERRNAGRPADQPHNNPHTITTILADLEHLHKYFPQVAIDLRNKCIECTTQDIILEDINFGPFKISYFWDKRKSETCIAVEAQKPYPACRDARIVHPHVEGKYICLGEAVTPLHKRIAEGDFYSVFMLVKGVLETYNPNGAYFSISDWRVIPCRDCGYSGDVARLTTCSWCKGSLCIDCGHFCSACVRRLCRDCGADRKRREICITCSRSYCISNVVADSLARIAEKK